MNLPKQYDPALPKISRLDLTPEPEPTFELDWEFPAFPSSLRTQLYGPYYNPTHLAVYAISFTKALRRITESNKKIVIHDSLPAFFDSIEKPRKEYWLVRWVKGV